MRARARVCVHACMGACTRVCARVSAFAHRQFPVEHCGDTGLPIAHLPRTRKAFCRAQCALGGVAYALYAECAWTATGEAIRLPPLALQTASVSALWLGGASVNASLLVLPYESIALGARIITDATLSAAAHRTRGAAPFASPLRLAAWATPCLACRTQYGCLAGRRGRQDGRA